MAFAADLPLWVELYDDQIGSSIDGCGCSDLEDAIPAAEDLLSQARRLNTDVFDVEVREIIDEVDCPFRRVRIETVCECGRKPA